MSSPHPELSPLALDAVKQWQFDPARKDGKPIPVPVTVNVEFRTAGGSCYLSKIIRCLRNTCVLIWPGLRICR